MTLQHGKTGRLYGLADSPYLLLVLAVFFWAGNFIVGRAVRADVPPVALAFWRWFVASILVTGLAWRHLPADLTALRRNWLPVTLLSIAGITMFNTLVYIGLQQTIAINALLMQSLMPVLIVGMSYVIFRERIGSVQAVGVVVSLAGALMIIAQGSLDVLLSLSMNRGDILVFLAVVGYAGYSIGLRKRPAVHPLSFVAATFVVGDLFLLPLYLWESAAGHRLMIDASAIMAIGYVAVFPSIISYLCFNRGVELVGANRAGMFIHLLPVFGSIMAIIFLGESLQWFHGGGILLIATGIFMATRSPR
jgi:drug/metabolite transporter (DMT)-like permease